MAYIREYPPPPPGRGITFRTNTIVSLKFRLIHVRVRIIYEKTKCQVPLGTLLGKQNIQATELY